MKIKFRVYLPGYIVIKCIRLVVASVAKPDAMLEELSTLLGGSFMNAIVWEQRDQDLFGKYVYIKYDNKEIGVFVGYLASDSGEIRGCISFFFAHPRSVAEGLGETRRLFHRLQIRLNLRIRSGRYKMLSGRSPAILRTIHFREHAFNADSAKRFFAESIDVIRSCEPLYKSATSADLRIAKKIS